MARKTLDAIPTTFKAAVQLLGNRLERTIGHNTRLRVSDSEQLELVYHSTAIARYYPDGAVKLYTGGFRTVSTKARLDRLAQAAGFRLRQRDREWTLEGISTDAIVRFYDGICLVTDQVARHMPISGRA